MNKSRKKADIVCIGEVLIDFISRDPCRGLAEVTSFEKFAGGAPANVAIGLAKLGTAVAFAGRVGDDPFGAFLVQYLNDRKVETTFLKKDSQHKTRLAFVCLDASGERTFEFWEKEPADTAIEIGDFPEELRDNIKIAHFGSLALSDEKSKTVFQQIAAHFEDSTTLISFDPNYRKSLWRSDEEARAVLGSFASQAHILKMAAEEALFLAKEVEFESAAQKLLNKKTKIIAITHGAQGCYLKTHQFHAVVPGFNVKTVDTTGCGDAFTAALLAKIIKIGLNIEGYTPEMLSDLGRYANAAGALVAGRRGGTASFPTEEEIIALTNQNQEKTEKG